MPSSKGVRTEPSEIKGGQKHGICYRQVLVEYEPAEKNRASPPPVTFSWQVDYPHYIFYVAPLIKPTVCVSFGDVMYIERMRKLLENFVLVFLSLAAVKASQKKTSSSPPLKLLEAKPPDGSTIDIDLSPSLEWNTSTAQDEVGLRL